MSYKHFFQGILAVTVQFACAQPSIGDILARIDTQGHLNSDITATVTIVETRPVQGESKFELTYFRRDRDDAFLAVLESPEVEKGNGYLKIGNDFWMYRKNTRTFQRISRAENIMGTDVKGSDLETRKFTQLYRPAAGPDGKESIVDTLLGKSGVYRFDVAARTNDVSYPKQRLWVRKDNFFILKIQSFSNSGALMQTQAFPEYTDLGGGRFLPLVGYVVDEFEKGNKSIFEIKNISVRKISDAVFTKSYLESLSR